MSVPTLRSGVRSRWLDWEPQGRILADSPEGEPTKPTKQECVGSVGETSGRSPVIETAQILADMPGTEPTKPSKPGCVGFEGATSTQSPKIEAGPDSAELARACTAMNRAGVRFMALEDGASIGLWSDLDGAGIRAALRTLGLNRLPARYLDGAGVPVRYKVRRVKGEPVPMNVLAEMERHSAEPWKVRDRMLNEMGWCSGTVAHRERAAGRRVWPLTKSMIRTPSVSAII
jgi:hypothetical protein